MLVQLISHGYLNIQHHASAQSFFGKTHVEYYATYAENKIPNMCLYVNDYRTNQRLQEHMYN
jgi:hypothetical protein